MKKLFVNNIGDLAEAQRASFYRFLSFGLAEELSTFPSPFKAKIRAFGKKRMNCLIYLFPNEIKLKGPNFTIENCLKREISYTIQIFVPGEYCYDLDIKNELNLSDVQNIKEIQLKQDIFFGEIPLMTEEGTFIISGCERVVISQIIRSPGIYFRKEFISAKKIIYSATLISNKGLWTKFILEQQKDLKKKKRKFR